MASTLFPSASIPPQAALTPRQWDVEEHVVKKPSHSELKEAICISYAGVNSTLSRMYPVYGVHGLLQLALLIYDKELREQWDAAGRIEPPLPFRLEDKITPAELDIVEFLRQGLSYREIASRRGVILQTIKNAIVDIRKKTGLPRIKLAMHAHREYFERMNTRS